jgi:mannose-1-phosphate guanylyltransferase/mannose-6-phosphate isomerase
LLKGLVMKDAYCVVLAGGAGERLWPISSYLRPKQLIPFINGTSLLEQTVQRIQPLVKNKNHVMVVTNADQQDAIKKLVGKQATVLAEPVGQNTAPAILLSCIEIYEKNDDAVVVVLPSDHFIPEAEKFSSMLWASIAFASCYEQIVLLGIKPTYAATGYGYIQYKADSYLPGWMCFQVQKFHEKPDKEHAQSYMERQDMLWNSGIVVARAKVFLDQFQQFMPEMFEAVSAYHKTEKGYEAVQNISFDHAILEKTDKIAVFPANFEWHDVGTLPAFLMLKSQYEKQTTTQVINIDAEQNLAYTTKKAVAFVGVQNLCVVETDDALLVVAQDRVESVRDVASFIKKQEQPSEDQPQESAQTTDSL